MCKGTIIAQHCVVKCLNVKSKMDIEGEASTFAWEVKEGLPARLREAFEMECKSLRGSTACLKICKKLGTAGP